MSEYRFEEFDPFLSRYDWQAVAYVSTRILVSLSTDPFPEDTASFFANDRAYSSSLGYDYHQHSIQDGDNILN